MIFLSPYTPIDLPNIPLTPWILERAIARKNKPALIDATTGKVWSYREFAEAVTRVAAGLVTHGFSKGDVLAIYSPNSAEYGIVFHAASLLGGTITTVNPLYLKNELIEQLKDSNSKYVFTTAALAERVFESTASVQLKTIFTAEKVPGAISFEELLSHDRTVEPAVFSPKDHVVALPYSSGTTGLPKGVMLTHFNLVSNVLQIAETGVVHENDVVICVLPMFHIYGLVVILNEVLYMGATVVIMQRYDLQQLLLNIQNYKVTLAPLVPPILLALTKNPIVKDYDLQNLQCIFSAAAPLSVEIGKECADKTGCLLKQGYGMTEASPATHMMPDDPDRIKMGSVGVLAPNTECRITEIGTGRTLGPNHEGEIWIRGPQVMKGYLNRAEATKHAIDSDGWLRTGDIGYADEDGYFYIVDRVKELIKYKGFQVAPAELESVLLSHPAVADAAVIPYPDMEAGEIPKAFVVLKVPCDTTEILNFVAEKVAPFKKIRSIQLIDQIPKSPSGKILRRLLKERSV